VNSLIREALIEGRTSEEKYEKDGYAVKWTFVNDLELIFVVRPKLLHSIAASRANYMSVQVAYQRILQLTYVDELLGALKALFIKLFEPFLASLVASLHSTASTAAESAVLPSFDFAKAFETWDKVFDGVLRNFEVQAAEDRKSRYKAPLWPQQQVALDSSPPSEDDSSTGALLLSTHC